MKKNAAVIFDEEGNLMWDDGREVDPCIIVDGREVDPCIIVDGREVDPCIIVDGYYVDVRADCHWVNFMGYEITGGWGEAAKIIGD